MSDNRQLCDNVDELNKKIREGTAKKFHIGTEEELESLIDRLTRPDTGSKE